MRNTVFLPMLLALTFLFSGAVMAAETVSFEPVKAPVRGSDKAPVTIIEIADYT